MKRKNLSTAILPRLSWWMTLAMVCSTSTTHPRDLTAGPFAWTGCLIPALRYFLSFHVSIIILAGFPPRYFDCVPKRSSGSILAFLTWFCRRFSVAILEISSWVALRSSASVLDSSTWFCLCSSAVDPFLFFDDLTHIQVIVQLMLQLQQVSC